jgi:hypothetical protein
LLYKNFLLTPLIWSGIFGSWGLGWLDTILPPAVWFLGFSAFAIWVLFGIWRLKIRVVIAGALTLGLMWIIPVYVLVRSHALVGTLVQPRYLLPLIVLFTGIILYRSDGESTLVTRSLMWIAVILLAAANSLSLHREIRRYITGVDVSGIDLSRNIEWWWSSSPIGPEIVWFAGSFAFLGLLSMLVLLTPKQGLGIGADGFVPLEQGDIMPRAPRAKSGNHLGDEPSGLG